MKKPLCVSIFVFGNYTRYIPYYLYSMLKSYPEYFVKVFIRERLPEKVKTCLNMINKEVSNNFEIKERYFRSLKLPGPQVGKAFKYLIPYEEYAEFENVYIGDVDFLIIKEKTPLLEGHVRHCRKIRLPYSNQVRPNSKRLTGLHFFQVEKYYEKMNPIIEYYRTHVDELSKMFKTFTTNEQFLYKLVDKGLGFGKIKDHVFRPHHGFHLGVIRGRDPEVKFKRYMYHDIKDPMFKLPRYREFKRQLMEYYNDPLFEKIMRINPIKEISFLYNQLKKN